MALTTSLIAYWKLEEAAGTRADSVGANNLTDNNTVTNAAGKVGNAAVFTAANSESLTRASEASLVTGDIDFTIACWVNLTTKAARAGIVLKDNNAGAGREYMLEYENTTDRIRWFVRATALPATTLGAPATATWYYVVAWHDSVANTQNIQVNNGTVDSAAFVHDTLSGAAPLAMGDWIGTNFLNGMIDECGFWKRVLTAPERTQLYNGGSGLTYPFGEGTPPKTSFRNSIRIGL